MWKLLRNLGLGAILLAGVLKLVAWYEVGQDAQRLVVALAPYAQLHYDSISAGLDGSVGLSGVMVTVKRGTAQEVYRADSVVLESPSVFWLLKHALLEDNRLPPHFGISTQGLKLPATPWLDPQWLNPATLVPFETLGCGTGAFTAADYNRMGVSAGDARQHLEYRYDDSAKLLDLSLTLTAPAFAKLTLEAEFKPFDSQSPVSLEKLHVDQLSADYVDTGYLQRRNQFCAQRTSMGPKQFAERHIAAAQALLEQHHIQASSELVKLYGHLVENGGQLSILSLPNSGFVVGAWWDNTPQDLLRQLNVTARYGDSPPVMFRLSFLAPVEAEPVPIAETPAPTTPVAPPPAVVPSVSNNTPAQAIAHPPAPAATPATASTPIRPATRVEPAAAAPVAASASAPKPIAAPVTAQIHVSAANLGLSNLDRAEARMMPPPKPAAPPPSKPLPPPSTTEFAPSEPKPSEGSTLALVWKSTIERLGAPTPEQQNYDVIDFGRLKDEQGRRIRLVTEGGKKVEGYVLAVDDTGVTLRINGGNVGGDVQFVIPKARIQQIQLLHRTSPPA